MIYVKLFQNKMLIVVFCAIACVVLVVFLVQILATLSSVSDLSSVLNEFTFRAEVEEVNPPGANGRFGATMLVRGLVGFYKGDAQMNNVYDILNNQYVIVLNEHGEPISLFDVPQGAIVDITFSGIVLDLQPGIIEGALKIQIITDF